MAKPDPEPCEHVKIKGSYCYTCDAGRDEYPDDFPTFVRKAAK